MLGNNLISLKYKFVFFVSIVLMSSGWAESIEYKNLERRNGLYYVESSKKLYTGYVTGQIEGKILKGKKEGLHYKYDQSGILINKANYNENILDGVQSEFFRDGGKLYMKNFKDGKLEGFYIDYYRTGQILSIRNYKNNKLDGIYLDFHVNGQLRNKKKFKEGKPEGEFLTYFEFDSITIQFHLFV